MASNPAAPNRIPVKQMPPAKPAKPLGPNTSPTPGL